MIEDYLSAALTKAREVGGRRIGEFCGRLHPRGITIEIETLLGRARFGRRQKYMSDRVVAQTRFDGRSGPKSSMCRASMRQPGEAKAGSHGQSE